MRPVTTIIVSCLKMYSLENKMTSHCFLTICFEMQLYTSVHRRPQARGPTNYFVEICHPLQEGSVGAFESASLSHIDGVVFGNMAWVWCVVSNRVLPLYLLGLSDWKSLEYVGLNVMLRPWNEILSRVTPRYNSRALPAGSKRKKRRTLVVKCYL